MSLKKASLSGRATPYIAHYRGTPGGGYSDDGKVSRLSFLALKLAFSDFLWVRNLLMDFSWVRRFCRDCFFFRVDEKRAYLRVLNLCQTIVLVQFLAPVRCTFIKERWTVLHCLGFFFPEKGFFFFMQKKRNFLSYAVGHWTFLSSVLAYGTVFGYENFGLICT